MIDIYDILISILVGGTICSLSQILLDKFKFTTAHLISLLVVIGAFLDAFSLYDKFIEVGKSGASLLITSFGHSLIHGALEEANETGYLGMLTGMFSLTSVGIISATLFSFLSGLVFKPRG